MGNSEPIPVSYLTLQSCPAAQIDAKFNAGMQMVHEMEQRLLNFPVQGLGFHNL